MNNLHLTDINLYAVFVAWIIHTATGLLWFQNKLFGKEWSKLTGKELKPAKNWIIPGFAGHLAMIFVLAIIIELANINTDPNRESIRRNRYFWFYPGCMAIKQ
jgi:hypothetical protein